MTLPLHPWRAAALGHIAPDERGPVLGVLVLLDDVSARAGLRRSLVHVDEDVLILDDIIVLVDLDRVSVTGQRSYPGGAARTQRHDHRDPLHPATVPQIGAAVA